MIHVWSITDVGLVRGENQDACAVCHEKDADSVLCVVCDGMGGAAAGQVASRIASSTFIESIKGDLRPDMNLEELQKVSLQAVSCANEAIQNAVEENAAYRGMGTTLVSAASAGGDFAICNIGDSRAYHITPDVITRITRDHSVVESMVERGDITEEEARHHPNRNLITRALGLDSVTKCDVYGCHLEAGEYLLLCTDGLIDTVTDQEMLFEIIHGDGIDTCLDRLVAIAKRRGAPDNVTAVLLEKR